MRNGGKQMGKDAGEKAASGTFADLHAGDRHGPGVDPLTAFGQPLFAPRPRPLVRAGGQATPVWAQLDDPFVCSRRVVLPSSVRESQQRVGKRKAGDG